MTAPASSYPPSGDPHARRWLLIRDLAVFTGKVALEAVRDVVLIPIALVAGVVGLLFQPREPDALFREVLRLGDRFDAFVDLFGAERRRSEQEARAAGEVSPRAVSFDALVDQLERVLVEQHHRGGITAQAKEAVDRALDAFQAPG